MAIIGLHALMYAKNDEATRRFLRDVLGFRGVDAGQGWLIFAMPPAELGVHPVDGEEYHELYLMCDDITATIAQLEKKGVATTPVQDRGWGLVTQISMPGGGALGMYQPRHAMAIRPRQARGRAKARRPVRRRTHSQPPARRKNKPGQSRRQR